MTCLAAATERYGARSPQSVLAFCGDVFASARPQRSRRKREVVIPHSKQVVKHISEFVRNGRVIDLFGIRAEFRGQPIPEANVLRVPYKTGSYSANFPIPWPGAYPQFKSLCMGQPTQFNNVTVTLDKTHLLPEMQFASGNVDLTWPDQSRPELTYHWLFFKWTFRLNGLVLTDTDGQLSIDGVPDKWLPKLVWGD